VGAAAAVVGLFLVWLVLVQPAWRTVREAPAKLDKLDGQLQQMERLAAESRDLRNATPPPLAQAQAALRSATERLGEQHARLNQQGDRAILTVTNVSGEQLRGWLAEARSGARARPIEAQIGRNPQGFSGTITVALGGAAP
jgi:general secretion pathway protein M